MGGARRQTMMMQWCRGATSIGLRHEPDPCEDRSRLRSPGPCGNAVREKAGMGGSQAGRGTCIRIHTQTALRARSVLVRSFQHRNKGRELVSECVTGGAGKVRYFKYNL